MSRTMIQAAVTMQQLQHQLDVIGHNLANSQTTGYKAKQTQFSSLLFQQKDHMNDETSTRQTPDGIRIGSGSRLGAIQTDLSAGSLQTTDRALDVALLEDDYLFAINRTINGATETVYTRDGQFYLSPTEDSQLLQLTTKDGDPVLGVNGTIYISDGFDHIHINDRGQIMTTYGNQTIQSGQLLISEVHVPHALEAVGQNAFRLIDTEGLGYNVEDIIEQIVPTEAIVQSGVLEQSNVDLAKQMTDMMIAQRSYQFNARTISMGDQMLGLINQLR